MEFPDGTTFVETSAFPMEICMPFEFEYTTSDDEEKVRVRYFQLIEKSISDELSEHDMTEIEKLIRMKGELAEKNDSLERALKAADNAEDLIKVLEYNIGTVPDEIAEALKVLYHQGKVKIEVLYTQTD